MFDAADRLTPTEILSHLDGAAPKDGSALEALDEAGMLGWDVRTVGVAAQDDAGTALDLPRSAATVYTAPNGTTQPIAVVGKGYTHIQNEEMASFLDALVATSGGTIAAAGYAPDRSSAFVTVKTPTTLQVGGDDKVGISVLVANSHDGSGAFLVRSELVRLVCSNGLTAAIPGTRNQLSVRHTSGAAESLDLAARSLDVVSAYAGAFQRAAEPMLTQRVVDARFAEIVEQLLPSQKEDNPHVSAVLDLRHLSSTIDEPMRSTAWGSYQAFTECVDHFMPARAAAPGVARARRAMAPLMQRARSRAFQALRPIGRALLGS